MRNAILLVVDDSDIIKVHTNDIIKRIREVNPRRQVLVRSILNMDGIEEYEIWKCVFITDGAKKTLETQCVNLWIEKMTKRRSPKCIMINLHDPESGVIHIDEPKLSVCTSDIVMIDTISNYEQWWPRVFDLIHENPGCLETCRSIQNVELKPIMFRVLATICLLLNIPLVIAWTCVCFPVCFVLISVNISDSNCSHWCLFIVQTIFTIPFLGLGWQLYSDEYRKSHDIRLNKTEVVIIFMIIIPFCVFVWGCIGSRILRNSKFEVMHVFELPARLWVGLDLSCILSMCKATQQLPTFIYKSIRLSFLIMSLLLNIPYLLILLSVCAVIWVILLALEILCTIGGGKLEDIFTINQSGSCNVNHIFDLHITGMFSTISIIFGVIATKYNIDYWNDGKIITIVLNYEWTIAVFCVLIPLYFIVWVSFVSHVAKHLFNCKWGIFSMIGKLC
ncbi:uncharacterized protein LOC127861444 isoform X1 [Dreissena polymorpha]|uniref:uncharacterized protein LOC127861444 isoform X1 n=1 Tax=Dreissena polymorpha TaxID=45954 RepID=UPI0022654EBC|nr:uncharacterized protein LOC127861444 isoform X1 [Dreissena polymorpha]XP_052255902.1 uncharacterized protein LOC127861444 isoform X1 [Dreissena polymorpha]XP_052255903.1 uncharacterized protein LOC127861444 isoform X1 [Dreissena polymorpha]XP_052255904.1 uncharacterized protein LOC127861444 isoform X1 [Dreissena polymorpha]